MNEFEMLEEHIKTACSSKSSFVTTVPDILKMLQNLKKQRERLVSDTDVNLVSWEEYQEIIEKIDPKKRPRTFNDFDALVMIAKLDDKIIAVALEDLV